MPACAIKLCKNILKKGTGITYHQFPADPDICEQWTSIVRLSREDSSWKPSKSTVICSIHFKESDYYFTKGGFKRLQKKSIPRQSLFLSPTLTEIIFKKFNVTAEPSSSVLPYHFNETTGNKISPLDNISDKNYVSIKSSCDKDIMQKVSSLVAKNNEISSLDHNNMIFNNKDAKFFLHQWNSKEPDNVCRTCLAVEGKMFHIGLCKLKQYYQNLTGVVFSQEDNLPKMLCWECIARLQNANNFREKALRSYNLLLKNVKKEATLSMDDVRSINRMENGLNSTLEATYMSDVSYEWTHSDDVTMIEVKEEVDMWPEAEFNETEDLNLKGNEKQEDPLDTHLTRRVSSARKRDAARSPSAKKIKTNNNEKRPRGVLDETIFEVVEVPLERALSEAARRATRPQYRVAPHRCDVCYKVFATPTAAEEHALRHNDMMGLFECEVCRCRWRTRVLLRKHFTETHTRDHICKLCPFTTRNRGVAKQHERFHKGVKFQCSLCPKEFASQSAYLSHLRLNHVCRYPCALCGFTFLTRRGVDAHKLRKHKRHKNTELRGPYCAECDVRFATDDAHDRHLQLTVVHRREDAQGKRLRNDYHIAEKRKSRWKSTKAKPEQGKPEPCASVCCEQCGEKLAGYRAYAQHFRRQHPGCNRTQYSGHAPAMCEHCGRIFQNPCMLRAHAFEHVDGAACGTGRAGKRTGAARHLHACPLCPKRFTEKSNRARHIHTIHHGAERRYRCSVCEKRFWEHSAMQSHYDHVHLNKPWPKRTRPPRPRTALATGQELESTGKDVNAED